MGDQGTHNPGDSALGDIFCLTDPSNRIFRGWLTHGWHCFKLENWKPASLCQPQTIKLSETGPSNQLLPYYRRILWQRSDHCVVDWFPRWNNRWKLNFGSEWLLCFFLCIDYYHFLVSGWSMYGWFEHLILKMMLVAKRKLQCKKTKHRQWKYVWYISWQLIVVFEIVVEKRILSFVLKSCLLVSWCLPPLVICCRILTEMRLKYRSIGREER